MIRICKGHVIIFKWREKVGTKRKKGGEILAGKGSHWDQKKIATGFNLAKK